MKRNAEVGLFTKSTTLGKPAYGKGQILMAEGFKEFLPFIAVIRRHRGRLVLGTLAGLNYSVVPRHIDEALLIYRVIYGQFSDLNLIPVSVETEKRFERYRTTVVPLVGKKSPAEMSIPRELKNTYWYFLDYQ